MQIDDFHLLEHTVTKPAPKSRFPTLRPPSWKTDMRS